MVMPVATTRVVDRRFGAVSVLLTLHARRPGRARNLARKGLSAVLAAQLVPVLQRCSRQFSGVLAAVFLAAMLGIFLFGNELWQRYADHYVAMLCVSAAALALCLARLELAPVFGLGWLAKMGALSYEIYLTHMLLILPFVAAAHALCGTKPYAAVLIYPPAVWACYQLGKMAERWVSRPLATQFFPSSRISAPQT